MRSTMAIDVHSDVRRSGSTILIAIAVLGWLLAAVAAWYALIVEGARLLASTQAELQLAQQTLARTKGEVDEQQARLAALENEAGNLEPRAAAAKGKIDDLEANVAART